MSVLTIDFDKLPQEEKDSIMTAVNRLCKDNPDVVREITKLADIKENNPKQWSLGKKFLKL